MSAEVVEHPMLARLRRQATSSPEQIVEAVRGALEDVLADGFPEDVTRRAVRKVASAILPEHLVEEALR